MVTFDKKAKTINGIKLAHGRLVCVEDADYECLYDHCLGMKDYVEIGTMHGASAIIAGYAVTGEVHCIDPFGVKGNRDRKDYSGDYVRPEYVRENWALHHDPARLRIHQQKNPPFPKSIERRMFDVALIDGDHTGPAVWADWDALKNRVKYKILFHDVNYKGAHRHKDSGAEKSAAQVFNTIAVTDKDWELVEVRGKMGVLKRK